MVTVDSELVAGRYKLIREVGRGGMGAVWLAHDAVLGRDVALKRLGQFQGTQSQARAQREAQLAARLSHPHVVTVFDLAEDGDTRWLVMEYVEGTTLSKLAADGGGLPPEKVAGIIRQAAEALSVAHAAGIVHRDVKPSNLIVAPDGTTKLTDFGIARGSADDTLTATGLLTGSPAYIAPEVASGQPASPASDVWSLGGTLFQALTGRPPYDLGDNLLAGLVRIVHDEPPRLPPGSGALGTVLAATMAKDPEARWTAAQVAGFLDVAASTTPTLGAPTPTPPSDTLVAAPGHDETRPLRPAPVHPLAPTPGTAGAPPATTRPPRRRITPLWPLLVGVLVLVLIGGAWLLGRSGSDDADQTRGAAHSPSTGSPSPTSRPSSNPSDSASPRGPSAEAMTGFVTDYLATVTHDPRAAFAMLTPGFQKSSGGWKGYHSWWAPIHGASVTNLHADPSTMTVSYHVVYDAPGRRLPADDVELRLVYDSGRYLIDGEPR